MPKNSDDIQLLVHKFCPFAQRAWIALSAKKVPFELVEVDLYDKPAWFLNLNPKGLVPVLVVDGNPVTESEDIIDFIDKMEPNVGSLTPSVTDAESLIATFRGLVNKEVGSAAKELVIGGKNNPNPAAEKKLAKALIALDALIQKNDGPLLCGKAISRADISAFPYLLRVDDLWTVENAAGRPVEALTEWMATMRKHPAVVETLQTVYWWWW